MNLRVYSEANYQEHSTKSGQLLKLLEGEK